MTSPALNREYSSVNQVHSLPIRKVPFILYSRRPDSLTATA